MFFVCIANSGALIIIVITGTHKKDISPTSTWSRTERPGPRHGRHRLDSRPQRPRLPCTWWSPRSCAFDTHLIAASICWTHSSERNPFEASSVRQSLFGFPLSQRIPTRRTRLASGSTVSRSRPSLLSKLTVLQFTPWRVTGSPVAGSIKLDPSTRNLAGEPVVVLVRLMSILSLEVESLVLFTFLIFVRAMGTISSKKLQVKFFDPKIFCRDIVKSHHFKFNRGSNFWASYLHIFGAKLFFAFIWKKNRPKFQVWKRQISFVLVPVPGPKFSFAGKSISTSTVVIVTFWNQPWLVALCDFNCELYQKKTFCQRCADDAHNGS